MSKGQGMSNIYIFAMVAIPMIAIVFTVVVKEFSIPFIMCMFVTCIGFMALVNNISQNDNGITSLSKELPSCKMIEENVYNGSFSENVNRLSCNGVIKNIPVSDYNSAMALSKDK